MQALQLKCRSLPILKQAPSVPRIKIKADQNVFQDQSNFAFHDRMPLHVLDTYKIKNNKF